MRKIWSLDMAIYASFTLAFAFAIACVILGIRLEKETKMMIKTGQYEKLSDDGPREADEQSDDEHYEQGGLNVSRKNFWRRWGPDIFWATIALAIIGTPLLALAYAVSGVHLKDAKHHDDRQSMRPVRVTTR